MMPLVWSVTFLLFYIQIFPSFAIVNLISRSLVADCSDWHSWLWLALTGLIKLVCEVNQHRKCLSWQQQCVKLACQPILASIPMCYYRGVWARGFSIVKYKYCYKNELNTSSIILDYGISYETLIWHDYTCPPRETFYVRKLKKLTGYQDDCLKNNQNMGGVLQHSLSFLWQINSGL